MLHKAERRTATTKTVRETEAEAIAFVVSQTIGLDSGRASADYIHLYHGNAALLAESLEVIQKTSALILSAIETEQVAAEQTEAAPSSRRHQRHRCSPRGGGLMQTILDILKRAGGWHPGLSLKIENQPYMALVIEAMDESGPCGLPAISVAHYGEQNGDAHARPGDVFRAWTGRRGAPDSLLLAQRLHGRGAVVPVHHRNGLRLSS